MSAYGLALLKAAGGFVVKHWRLIAIAMLTAGLMIQAGTLDRVTRQRDQARAAQINPATGKTWRAEAERDGAALGICHGNVDVLTAAVGTQNTAIAAARDQGARMAAAAEQAARGMRGARAVAESRARDLMTATVDGATCEARERQLLELAAGSLK